MLYFVLVIVYFVCLVVVGGCCGIEVMFCLVCD